MIWILGTLLWMVVVHFVPSTTPILNVVAITLLLFHDTVDDARGVVLAVVLRTTSQLVFLALAVALVDVAAWHCRHAYSYQGWRGGSHPWHRSPEVARGCFDRPPPGWWGGCCAQVDWIDCMNGDLTKMRRTWLPRSSPPPGS
jgi:hypothetical protein